MTCDELASADGFLSSPHDIWDAVDDDEDNNAPHKVQRSFPEAVSGDIGDSCCVHIWVEFSRNIVQG